VQTLGQQVTLPYIKETGAVDRDGQAMFAVILFSSTQSTLKGRSPESTPQNSRGKRFLQSRLKAPFEVLRPSVGTLVGDSYQVADAQIEIRLFAFFASSGAVRPGNSFHFATV
jgi:hypothetical protein